jgi:hypothetical protein
VALGDFLVLRVFGVLGIWIDALWVHWQRGDLMTER